jgi:hypothetical protein
MTERLRAILHVLPELSSVGNAFAKPAREGSPTKSRCSSVCSGRPAPSGIRFSPHSLARAQVRLELHGQ